MVMKKTNENDDSGAIMHICALLYKKILSSCTLQPPKVAVTPPIKVLLPASGNPAGCVQVAFCNLHEKVENRLFALESSDMP